MPNDSLHELIHRQRPGFSLERAFYTSPEIFEHDIERIYQRYWLFVGHVGRIPNPGDYFLYELAGDSMIVVRQPDGEVRAFHNVCRHRGSRVCLTEEGHAGKFDYPYHSWTFGLNGALLRARKMDDDFDASTYTLHSVPVRVVESLIFLCLAQDPPEFDAVAGHIEEFFHPHGWPQAKIATRARHVIRANWKLVTENFSECYHCATTHPELAVVMSYVHAAHSPRADQELVDYPCASQRIINRI